jgi:hypothetical protein
MAKKKKKKRPISKTETKKKQLSFFAKHPNWATVIIISILLLIFYHQIVFEGKTLLPPDTLTAKSYKTFINDALKQGTYPLWNPYIFSGMPSLGSLTAPLINIVDTVINYTLIGIGYILPLTPFMRILLNYLFFGLLTYLLLISLNTNRLAALFSAIAVVFLPQFIAFTAFGHNSKFLSVVLIPLIFWSVNQLLHKKNLLFFSLTALAIGFQLLRAHVQVCYYTYLFIGIYFIYYAIIEYKATKKLNSIVKSAGLLAGTVVVALLLSSVLYISVYEYSHYSIRGGGVSGGLDYDYASNWSFSPAEMITFLVPSFFGFGGATYWGKMPFTDYPLYMGIIVLFLAGLALIIRHDRYVIFFAIIALFSLIVSFGKHLPILYGPMFKLLPFFNKFRVPSMIHILLDISVVLMAGLGLHYLINLKQSGDNQIIQKKYQSIKKYFYIFGAIGILILLFVTLGKGTILNWIVSSGKISSSAYQVAYQMALKDTVIMLILLGISGFIVLYYLNKELKTELLGIGLIFLLIVDLWLIDFKIIEPKPAVDEQSFFRKTDVVEFLEQQKQPFRIFPIRLNQPGEKPDNWYMYFKLQNVYGYHAAKLKIYQETLEELQLPHLYMLKFLKQGVDDRGQQIVQLRTLEEVPLNLLYAHQAFLNMLNVKYLISAYPIPDTSCQLIKRGSALIYENKHALPRAYFVDNIKTLSLKQEIFDFIGSGQFDPARTAILEEEPEFTVQPNPENQVELISYDIHKIKLKASLKSPSLMVLSEIYYPAGWKAYVDGELTKIYKTNYILRSIFLESGDHQVEFVFGPKSFYVGLIISIITCILLIVTLIYSIKMKRQG